MVSIGNVLQDGREVSIPVSDMRDLPIPIQQEIAITISLSGTNYSASKQRQMEIPGSTRFTFDLSDTAVESTLQGFKDLNITVENISNGDMDSVTYTLDQIGSGGGGGDGGSTPGSSPFTKEALIGAGAVALGVYAVTRD